MLYYDPEDLNRQILEYETEQAQKRGYEKGHKEGLKKGHEEGKKEGIEQNTKEIEKNMLKAGCSEEIIIKYLNIDKKTLFNIKNEL